MNPPLLVNMDLGINTKDIIGITANPKHIPEIFILQLTCHQEE